MSTRTRIVNGRILVAGRFVENHLLEIEDDRIVGVRPCREGDSESAGTDDRILDAAGGYVVPGLVDIHVHGGGGHDMMDLSVESLRRMSRFHARRGTTSVVPTTIASPPEILRRAVDVTREAMGDESGDGRILGLHLEGPYMAPGKRGAHPPEFLRDPVVDEIDGWIAAAPVVNRVTLAPELPGAIEATRRLAAAGIVVSLGHSETDYDHAMRAVDAGARLVTHLYNAMSAMHKQGSYRVAGLVEAALIEDALVAELIGDGHHVCAELVQLAWRAKGRDRFCFITDALGAAGLPEGATFQLGEGLTAAVQGGVAMVEPEREVFAGSVILLADAVRIAIHRFGFEPADAFTSVTETPARVIGQDDRLGQIAPGRLADVAVYDEKIEPLHVLIGGRPVDLDDPAA